MARVEATPERATPSGGEAHARGRDDASAFPFQSVVGDSGEIRRALELAYKVAEHPTTTVLLDGETGTGKELFARGIHYAGANSGDPFVAINCSAIPENLLESELFGHEEGAFTDARSQKRGLLELAARGTVFLDEIGELPPKLQPKLLRVLEEKRVRRLGGLEEHGIECRIIAATNRDLARSVHEGHFREDLYYRLNVFRIELPALRHRGADVVDLAHHFVEEMCRDQGFEPKTLSDEAGVALRAHSWPGNVRELKNVIERAIILCEGERIEAEHILIQQRASVPASVAIDERDAVAAIRVPADGMTFEEAERRLLEITLELVDDNQTRAARVLGVSRPTVIRKIRKYGLR